MKILTKNKQEDALLAMTANAIIAYEAVQIKPYVEFIDSANHIIENLSNAAFIIGGDKGQRKAMKTFCDKTSIDIQTYIKIKAYGKI